MDGYTERQLIEALGMLSLVKGGAENLGGLTESQESEVNEAMRHIGNIFLEEETIRKSAGCIGGRVAA